MGFSDVVLKMVDKSTDDFVKTFTALSENLSKIAVENDLEEIKIAGILSIKRNSENIRSKKENNEIALKKLQIKNNPDYGQAE